MKEDFKKLIGNLAINLGKHAIGKCMIPGMYDPQIPDKIKEDVRKEDMKDIVSYDFIVKIE